MPVPADTKDAAIYHTILSNMHRLRATMLNLQAIEHGETEAALRDHFGREQTVLLGKLREWRQHRSALFKQAEADFAEQARVASEQGR
jgi:hypothetical protein